MRVTLLSKNLDIVILASVSLLLSLCFIGLTKVSASTSSIVEADVKVGVCGDLEAAGIEQCDNSDIRGRTCADFGYSSGVLTCDTACDFDFSGCVEKPTSTSTPASPSANSSTSASGRGGEVPLDAIYVKVLPLIDPFDLNNNGEISENELIDIIEHWMDIRINPENGICDLDTNDRCNVIDFSILMYYVNR